MEILGFKMGEKNRDKLLPILFLYFAIFSSPLRCYGVFYIYGFVGSFFKLSIFLYSIFLGATFLNRPIYYRGTAIKLYCAISAYNLVTLLYSSSELGLFPSYFSSFLFLIIATIGIGKNNKNLFYSVKIFVFSVFIPGLLGLYQWSYYFKNGSVPNLPFPQFVVVEVREIVLYSNVRIESTLLDPSYFGLYAASIFIISAGILLNWNTLKSVFQNQFKQVCYFGAIISILSVLSTGSVSSIVNLLIGTISLAILTPRKGNGKVSLFKMLTIVIYIIILIISVGTIVFCFLRFNAFEAFVEKIQIQKGSSTVGEIFCRALYFRQAIKEFLSSPVLGVGFGNLELTSGHNSFLTVLAQQGLIGIALHLYLIIIIPFSRAIKLKRQSRESPEVLMFYILISALIGSLAQLMAYDCLYKMDSLTVLIFLVLTSSEQVRLAKIQNNYRIGYVNP